MTRHWTNWQRMRKKITCEALGSPPNGTRSPVCETHPSQVSAMRQHRLTPRCTTQLPRHIIRVRASCIACRKWVQLRWVRHDCLSRLLNNRTKPRRWNTCQTGPPAAYFTYRAAAGPVSNGWTLVHFKLDYPKSFTYPNECSGSSFPVKGIHRDVPFRSTAFAPDSPQLTAGCYRELERKRHPLSRLCSMCGGISCGPGMRPMVSHPLFRKAHWQTEESAPLRCRHRVQTPSDWMCTHSPQLAVVAPLRRARRGWWGWGGVWRGAAH